MGAPAIQLERITKRYAGREILSDIDLSLGSGQFCALVGKNGVGKSTLMRIVARQELPNSGHGKLLGKDMSIDDHRFNQDIGYASESLEFVLPVRIRTFFKHFSRSFERWDAKLFDEVLETLGLSQNSYHKQLSRGQRMHVAFAAAIARKPKLLLLDEITSVLDANARAYFMGLLKEFTGGGGTVVLATNIISEVQHYADRLVLLHDRTVKINQTMKQVSAIYKKLRKNKGEEHPIFLDPACAEVALNSDGSQSFIVPGDLLEKHSVADSMRDNRGITAEEIFIYFTRKRYQ